MDLCPSDPVPSSRQFTPSILDAEPYAPVRIVRLSELAYEDRGWTRGHAHIGFDEYPHGAPGRLDFGPVKLAALQTVNAGTGYALHPHAEIETLTFMLEGAMLHEDSLGYRVRVRRSEVALLSAGTGMSHSELADPSGPARVLLFWLEPSERGAAPRFLHRPFPRERRRNRLARLASGRTDAPESALPLRRDVELCAGRVDAGVAVLHRVGRERRAYVLAPDAALRVNGETMAPGERALVTGAGVVELVPDAPTEVVVLDVD